MSIPRLTVEGNVVVNSNGEHVQAIERATSPPELGIARHRITGDSADLAAHSRAQRERMDVKRQAGERTLGAWVLRIFICMLLLPFIIAGCFFCVALVGKIGRMFGWEWAG